MLQSYQAYSVYLGGFKMRKFKLEKYIVFESSMNDFNKNVEKAWQKLKNELVLISELKN
jgi:hypothetical protein